MVRISAAWNVSWRGSDLGLTLIHHFQIWHSWCPLSRTNVHLSASYKRVTTFLSRFQNWTIVFFTGDIQPKRPFIFLPRTAWFVRLWIVDKGAFSRHWIGRTLNAYNTVGRQNRKQCVTRSFLIACMLSNAFLFRCWMLPALLVCNSGLQLQ